MQTSAPSRSPFADVKLGDILRLPDGRRLTVRGREHLPAPVGPMAGFLVCEELELLISVPTRRDLPASLFAPMYEEPDVVKNGREVYRGEMLYWAPHLPAAADAMGALQFRVVEVRGSIHPAVVIYRTGEPVVFVHIGDVDVSTLGLQRMHRGDENATRHERQSSVLTPLGEPATAPTPATVYERFAAR